MRAEETVKGAGLVSGDIVFLMGGAGWGRNIGGGDDSEAEEVSGAVGELWTLSPKPEILSPNPETRNSKPRTLNPKPKP